MTTTAAIVTTVRIVFIAKVFGPDMQSTSGRVRIGLA
jgi:hypothetical protein